MSNKPASNQTGSDAIETMLSTIDNILIEVRHGRMSNTKAKQAIQAEITRARIDELDQLLAPLDSVFAQSVDELTIVKRMAKLKRESLDLKAQTTQEDSNHE